MINVIYLSSYLPLYVGPINQAYNIVTGADPNLVRYIVVTFQNEIKDKSAIDKFQNANIEVIQLCYGYNIIKLIKSLKRIINERNIDIVHSCGFRANLINSLLTKTTKVTTLRNEPDYSSEVKIPFYSVLRKYLYLYGIKKMDGVITCSSYLADIFRDKYGIDNYLINNSVDTSVFHPSDENSVNILKRQLSITPDKKVFLVSSVLVPRKNNRLIIEVFNEIHRDDYVLLFAGDGVEREMLESMINHSNIRFLGNVKNVAEIISISYYLLSASKSEGLPNSVLEALACGVPCILSDIKPHIDLAEGVDIGFFFRNSLELKDILTNKINNETRVRQRKNALNLVEKKYSKYGMAADYYKAYVEILNK